MNAKAFKLCSQIPILSSLEILQKQYMYCNSEFTYTSLQDLRHWDGIIFAVNHLYIPRAQHSFLSMRNK